MHPKRLRRFPEFDYLGPHRYSLTLCSFKRESIFEDDAIVSVLVEQILRAATDSEFEIVAYCFMPDHVHLLVQGGSPTASLPEFVQRAKQLSGLHGKRIAGRAIWQTGYFDLVLRENEGTWAVIAYILANPVRAGLVEKPDDWPFIGSGVYSRAELMEYVQDGARSNPRPS